MSRIDKPRLVTTCEQRLSYFEKMLKRLCTDLGPHPSGTRAYEKATRIILREISAALPVAFLDRYLDFWATPVPPRILHKGRPLPVGVAENCAGTSDGGFSGVIRRIDQDGIPYGIEDVKTGEIAAYITVSSDVGIQPEYLVGDAVLSLPRFVTGIRDAPLVDLLIADEAEVQVLLRVVHAPKIPTYNVVGTLPGKSRDEILFIAHADSLHMTEGGNDNTATAIILMMLAQALADSAPRCTLTLLISGSEECGLMGARHYARRRVVEGSHGHLKFIVNSDSLTYGPNLWTSTEDEELMALVKTIHADLDLNTEPIYTAESCWMNDASCFEGINTHVRGINFNSRGHDTLAANHTPDDTADNVPRDCVESSFAVLLELANRLQDL
jgi:hypothetical protein